MLLKSKSGIFLVLTVATTSRDWRTHTSTARVLIISTFATYGVRVTERIITVRIPADICITMSGRRRMFVSIVDVLCLDVDV